jgi:hypothetical protein
MAFEHRRGYTGQVELAATPARVQRRGVTVCGWEAKLAGCPPTYCGWKILARFDFSTQQATVSVVPGHHRTWRQVTPGVCDCCGVFRMRNETFLLEHCETGEHKQVGSQCMKQFLGVSPVWVDFGTLAHSLELDRVSPPEQRRGWDYQLTDVVEAALAVIAEHGWVPHSATDDWRQRTSTRVKTTLGIYPGTGPAGFHGPVAEATVPAAIAGIRARHQNDRGGYGQEVATVFAADTVPENKIALAVSAVGSWWKHNNHTDPGKPPGGRFLADPGQKVMVTGSVKSVWQTGNNLARRVVVVCGQAVLQFTTSAEWVWQIEPGDLVELSAVVKRHETFNGETHTRLQRVKLLQHTKPGPGGEPVHISGQICGCPSDPTGGPIQIDIKPTTCVPQIGAQTVRLTITDTRTATGWRVGDHIEFDAIPLNPPNPHSDRLHLRSPTDVEIHPKVTLEGTP